MIEHNFNTQQSKSRVKNAFGWIVLFKDFPEGSWQTMVGDPDSAWDEAITLFLKGNTAILYNGQHMHDRRPGYLSSSAPEWWQGGEIELRYTESASRLCIFKGINSDKIPNVTKIELDSGQEITLPPGSKMLVCLGSVEVSNKTFNAEKTFSVGEESRVIKALDRVIMLDFTRSND